MTTKSKARKPARKKQAAALAPQTQPADPQQGRVLFLSQRVAGVRVTEETALTQSAVWACMRVIAETLAGMPWSVARKLKGGTHETIDDHPLNWLLDHAPNFETRAFAFREMLWSHAIIWGNGFAEIERDTIGRPVNLWQIHPARVRVLRDQGDTLVYEIHNHKGPPDYLFPNDIFHLMGPSPDGLVGWSVIRMHARTIGLSMAQEENATQINANDSTPGGMLIHPGRLSDEARKNLEESWERRHRGPENRRRLAILEENLKWEQTGLPPQEAQLVEQMQLTPAMICRIFRVPPHKIADLTRSTNNNIEHQDIEFVNDTLRPWAERGEGEADVKLIGRNNQQKLITVIDMDERRRGDTSARSLHVKEMVDRGIYSINDGLHYLGKPGIGPLGDKRFVQANMVLLENAGKEQPEQAPKPSGDEPDERMAKLEAGCMGLVVDACRRIIKRDQDAKHLADGELGVWLAKHRDYCRESLTPAVYLLAEICHASQQAADVAVSLFIDDHLKDGAGTPEAKAADMKSYLLAAAAAKGAA